MNEKDIARIEVASRQKLINQAVTREIDVTGINKLRLYQFILRAMLSPEPKKNWNKGLIT